MQNPDIVITVESGEIQSVFIHPTHRCDVSIIVKGMNINDDCDYPRIIPDEYGEQCEWQISESTPMNHSSNQ